MFQSLMVGGSEGLWDYAGAYLEDITFSKIREDYLVLDRDILKQIKDDGLTMNPSRCSFAKSQVGYLGFVMGCGSVRPQVEKVRAHTDTPSIMN